MKQIHRITTGLALLVMTSSVQAASIGVDTAVPTNNVLTENVSAGSGGVGFFDVPDTRYAWGQSFTVTAEWTIDKITLQRYSPSFPAEAGRQLKVAIFPMADFEADAFGSFSDPFAGQTTVPVYVETFDASAETPQYRWITFDLTTNPTLLPGSYGVATWVTGATEGWSWSNGGTYDGGDRLRIRGDSGNALLAGSDLKFVVQGTESALPGGTVIVGGKPTGSILAEQTVGTELLGMDAEERDPNTRHAWGQSFTAATDWSLSSVAVEAGSSGVPGDSDAQMKVAVFEYDENTFTNDAWGTFSDPFNGAATTVLYEEVFDLTNSAANGDWITMVLSSNVDLTASNAYGFAFWMSDPPDGSTPVLKSSLDAYNGGNILRVRSDLGNTVVNGNGDEADMNFVLQGSGELAITQFETSETDLASGEMAILTWFAIESESVTIDLEGGDNVVTTIEQSGTVVVTPPVGTNTYVMIATNSTDGSVTSSVEIVVSSDPDALMLTSFDSAVVVGGPPNQYEDTPAYVIADLGPTVDYDCTAAYGANAVADEMRIRTSSDGKNFIGTTCRQMSGTNNGLPEAIANNVYIEMRLDSVSDIGYTLGSMELDTISQRTQGGNSSWGIAVLYDLNGDSSYTADEALAQIDGTFPVGTIVSTTNITLSTIPEMIGVVDPTFRFYLWENYDSTSAAAMQFGIENIILTQASDISTPVVAVANGQFGMVDVAASNLTPYATSTLQSKSDLVYGIWVDVSGTSTQGVSEVVWSVSATNPAAFYRVKSE